MTNYENPFKPSESRDDPTDESRDGKTGLVDYRPGCVELIVLACALFLVVVIAICVLFPAVEM